MLDGFIERYTYTVALQHFNLKGDKHQLHELELILRYLSSIPTGRQLIQQAIYSTPTKLNLGFNLDITTTGVFRRSSNSIDLFPIATNIPGQTDQQKQMARLNMALSLAHELHHFIHKDKIAQLQRSAANINDFSFACNLMETDAYLWEQIAYEELRSKYYPDHIYVYHHPNDPEDKMRHAKTPEDLEFKKYGGRAITVQFQNTQEFRNRFVQKALSGQNDSLNSSVMREVNEAMENAPLTFNKPSPPEFYETVQFFLQDTHTDISIDQALDMAGLQPRPKHQKSWLARLIHTR